MLTDDDLTRQLGAAFRGATDDLTYTGRVPTPRHPALLVAGPAVATVAAVATLVAATGAPGGDAPAPGATATHRPTQEAGEADGSVITEEIEVAGFTLRYQRTAGLPDPIRAVTDTTVPGDARSLDVEAPVRAWVGTDPASGDAAVWAQSPIRYGGQIFALMSSTWTPDQLVDLLLGGAPS